MPDDLITSEDRRRLLRSVRIQKKERRRTTPPTWRKTPCIICTLATDTTGYALIWIENRLQKAHRVAYQIYRGRIPTGMEIDHLCRNRRCCNPWHLEIVTHQENIRRGLTGMRKAHRPRQRKSDRKTGLLPFGSQK